MKKTKDLLPVDSKKSDKANSKTKRMYGGRSLAERELERKRKFMQAGLQLFGTQGFRQATVRAICKEAQLTDRYFYQSFGSLETLLLAVYEDCMTHLSKEILAAITEGYQDQDPGTAIIAGLDKFFEVLEDPKVAQICMVELEGISPEVNKLYYHYINGFASILIALAKQAFPKLPMNTTQQHTIAISLVGAMRQAATHWLVNNYHLPREELVRANSHIFLGLIKLFKDEN